MAVKQSRPNYSKKNLTPNTTELTKAPIMDNINKQRAFLFQTAWRDSKFLMACFIIFPAPDTHLCICRLYNTCGALGRSHAYKNAHVTGTAGCIRRITVHRVQAHADMRQLFNISHIIRYLCCELNTTYTGRIILLLTCKTNFSRYQYEFCWRSRFS